MIELRKPIQPKNMHGPLFTEQTTLAYDDYDALLVLGGSKSGKSKNMETWAVDMAQERDVPLIYLATMDAGHDEENLKRIQRHQTQRAGRGFTTLEKPFQLTTLLASIPKDSVVLVECLGTLLSNEMFHPANVERQAKWREDSNGSETVSIAQVVQSIIDDLRSLSQRTSCLILASNDVFHDAIPYHDSVLHWRACLGTLHARLSATAGVCTIEVAAGIPLLLREEKRKHHDA